MFKVTRELLDDQAISYLKIILDVEDPNSIDWNEIKIKYQGSIFNETTEESDPIKILQWHNDIEIIEL